MKEIFVTSPDTIAQLIIELHLTKGMRREKRRIRSKVALLVMQSPSPIPWGTVFIPGEARGGNLPDFRHFNT